MNERTVTIQSPTGILPVKRNEPLSRYTTFRIGGPADFLVRAATRDDVLAALAWADQHQLPVTVIGGGSNLLVGDRGIRGLVVVVRAPSTQLDDQFRIEPDGQDHALVTVPAQAPISWLGHATSAQGLAGLEWTAGLPGVVGGAVVNNAGAHGGEMADYLVSLTLLDTETFDLVQWTRAMLEPRYRMTTLKAAPRPRRWVVLEATFRLPYGDRAALQSRVAELTRWRRVHQPTGACAGSVFTNPPGTYAGYLIEQAGLKGLQIGGVKVSERHANFFINTGTATAADVRALIATIQEVVQQRFGIVLVPEIEQIGEE